MIDWENSDLYFLGSGRDIRHIDTKSFLVFVDLKRLIYLENGKPLIREPEWIKCYEDELDENTYELFIKRANEKLLFDNDRVIVDDKDWFSVKIATVAIIQDLDSDGKEYYSLVYKSKPGFTLYNSVERVAITYNSKLFKKYAYYILDNKLIDKFEYDKKFIQRLSKLNSKLKIIGENTVDFDVDEYGILAAEYLSPYLKREDVYNIMSHCNVLTNESFKDCTLTNIIIPNNICVLILKESKFTKNLKSIQINCNSSSNIDIEINSKIIENIQFKGRPKGINLCLSAENLKTLILPTCESLSVKLQSVCNLDKLVIKDNSNLVYSFIQDSNIKDVILGRDIYFEADAEDGYTLTESLFESCSIKNLHMRTLKQIALKNCNIENLYLDRSMRGEKLREFINCNITNYIYT